MLKRIEAIANVAIIITAILLCVILVKNYLIPVPPPPTSNGSASATNNVQNDRQLKPGTKLSYEGVDWAKNGQTLLLALSATCHFCSESAPFYQRLMRERRGDVRVVAALPQPITDDRAYMKKLGVAADEVKQVPLGSLGVEGTPTLILVDNTGSVVQSWVGQLSEDEESKVLSRVRQNVADK